MARTASPLRYPGGKSSLLAIVSSILKINKLDRGHYVEPFAGGAGLALSLLYKGDVAAIHLNDLDPAIAAFWRAVLNQSEDLIELMMSTPVTLEERARQREVYLNRNCDDVTLGFAALFLNRVNRSGIIRTGGVIGGLKQDGAYKLDCRFNKDDLAARVRRIARYRRRIHFTSMDAGELLSHLSGQLPQRSLVYADPPYYLKGAELYTSSFQHADHSEFCDKMLAFNSPWILTYDDVPQIRKMYRARRQFAFDLYYSAQVKRQGNELLVASKGLRLPQDLRARSVNVPQYRSLASVA